MGKSAKFHKRPTRKEKLGLSSASSTVRAAIINSKFKQVEQTIVPKHVNKTDQLEKSDKPYSLIQNPKAIVDDDDNDQMELDNDFGLNKKKRKDLKLKVTKKLKATSNLITSDQLDYIDLYEKSDPRNKKKQ
ncbi:hypothetical protein O181_104768 [Austropuccinia psidii MF-1]|uniref:Uncharacterized protein n=1 Tax=Austropuccinia psidii MF-1 TaxID=1389203 RepID=A0A9Q3PKB8_9BASI|nr:hypothetical protein [Austropuccinia psidii MF-1]